MQYCTYDLNFFSDGTFTGALAKLLHLLFTGFANLTKLVSFINTFIKSFMHYVVF